MKNSIVTLLLLFLIIGSVFGQNSWKWQNPLPQGNDLLDVFVFDQNNAIAVGAKGSILKTNDGGNNWNFQSNAGGTANILQSVYFYNEMLGWAVGTNGSIIKTSDGGANWVSQTSSATSELEAVFFVDADTGWAVGWSGMILKTTDGGDNW